MPSYDFEVDLESLVNAAQKTAEVIQLKKDNDVEDYVPTLKAVSNEFYSRATHRPAKPLVRQRLRTAMHKPQ